MSRKLTFAYRLLLRAYPNGPRREELADTLLMAADSGQVRPGPRETVNLLRHGMRARLGRSYSRSIVVLAMIGSIAAGFLSAALANRIAWEAVPALPGATERTYLVELFSPGLTPEWYESTDSPFRDNAGETDAASISYSTGRTPATENVDAYISALRQRLDAAGWRVTDTYPTAPTSIATGARQNNSQGLIARNDTLVLSFEDYYAPASGEGGLRVSIYRAEPGWLTATTLAFGLAGMLAGWLLIGWASRRLHHRPWAEFIATAAAATGLVLLTPAWLLGVAHALGTLSGTSLPDSPFWRGLVPTDEFGGLAYPAAAAIVVALATVVVCRPASATEPSAESTAELR